MRIEASSIEEYLDKIPKDRREQLEKVRKVILDNLPEGYEEAFNWGMITYQVPLKTYPDTYNGQPLMYAALASQKNHMAVYLTNVYSENETEDWFKKEYEATGKKLDMGKSCVRFKKLDDLPLELIGKAIAMTSVDELIDIYAKLRKK